MGIRAPNPSINMALAFSIKVNDLIQACTLASVRPAQKKTNWLIGIFAKASSSAP